MRRRFFHHLFRLLTGVCALTAALVLVFILQAVIRRGWPAVDWSFFTGAMAAAGSEGGILHHICGTGILLATAFAASAPAALGLALMHQVYLRRRPRLQHRLMLGLYVLNGVPAILFGLFGMIVFVQVLGWGKSWLAGGLILGFMILPTVTVTLAERMAAIPRAQVDAAAALGLRTPQIIRAILLPQSLGGLITGSLLGLARAGGETAPIMFTATVFAGAGLPDGIRENPVLSLPYHIFVLAQDSYDPGTVPRIWGTALTLLLIVSLLSLAALPARLRLQDSSRHD